MARRLWAPPPSPLPRCAARSGPAHAPSVPHVPLAGAGGRRHWSGSGGSYRGAPGSGFLARWVACPVSYGGGGGG
eukprot:11242248-Alexandrium_andersonii.AAC.1